MDVSGNTGGRKGTDALCAWLTDSKGVRCALQKLYLMNCDLDITALCGALTFAELGSLRPEAGGHYAYLRDAYHPLAGFMYGWGLLLIIESGAIAAVAITFAQYALRLVGNEGAATVPLAIAAIVVVTVVNYFGVKPGSRLLNVFVVLKVAALAALIVAGLFILGFANGAWDVAMNVQGAAVERHLGRSIMSRFHAGYSLGTVAGALIGAAMVALGVPVTAHLLAVAALQGCQTSLNYEDTEPISGANPELNGTDSSAPVLEMPEPATEEVLEDEAPALIWSDLTRMAREAQQRGEYDEAEERLDQAAILVSALPATDARRRAVFGARARYAEQLAYRDELGRADALADLLFGEAELEPALGDTALVSLARSVAARRATAEAALESQDPKAAKSESPPSEFSEYRILRKSAGG